ncbi:SLC13 family permease [bacterium]|nr:SLC13 family permease [bacterium]
MAKEEINSSTQNSSNNLIFVALKHFDWKRTLFLLLGLGLFFIIFLSPPWSDAVDPMGKHFALSPQGKAAIGLFALTLTWWVFEVLPIGVTSITVAVVQGLFLIRNAKAAFTDFMDPSVWFIFASLTIGLAFTKTGLTKRMAYKMLIYMGERTIFIYLGCFILIALLTLIMAHTAVAATMYPLLLAIYSLYEEDEKPTKFGKGLFIGMAYACGAGSIVTLLGAARAAVAIAFFKDFINREISFFELTYYMLPVGWLMIIIIWLYTCIIFKPEKKTIPGLRQRVKVLYKNLGAITTKEIVTLVIVLSVVLILILRFFIEAIAPIDKSAIILTATILFFVLKILSVKDLEEISWNIVLLFGGAMSIGYCLWQTGAAEWMAVKWLVLFQQTHWLIFVLGISFFVMLLTNFIMNVAAITITLPVSIVIGNYLKVAPEVISFSCLVVAGMPFLLLIGAAPNAIAYASNQFKTGEFFFAGIPISIVLMIVLGIFAYWIWPLMGMPCLLP